MPVPMIDFVHSTPIPIRAMPASENLQKLQQEIMSLQQEEPSLAAEDIHIIAVSKTITAEQIRPVLAMGHCDFAENRVQEAQQKWHSLKSEYPQTRLHLIGPLQRNKVKLAVSLFDVIHTLDRPSLISPLQQAMQEADKMLPLFIQINISQEPQKSGIALEQADELISAAKEVFGTQIIGVMGIAKQNDEPAPYFALLQQMGKRHHLPCLSMGMSHDYPTAIRFGATHIRIGSLIFGERHI